MTEASNTPRRGWSNADGSSISAMSFHRPKLRLAAWLWLKGLLPVGAVACLAIAVQAAEYESDNNSFAFQLYNHLRGTDGSVFLSPFSVSEALAMTSAGARRETAVQMARVLDVPPGKEADALYAAQAEQLAKLGSAGAIELRMANSLWPQSGYPLLKDYLARVRKSYGVDVIPLDFAHNAEHARGAINDWVAKETRGKIADLIPPGILDSLTRLVLVNAIYFKGTWESPFVGEYTREAPFHVAKDRTVQVPTMVQSGDFRYANLDRLEILELPYAGGQVSMLILLPREQDGIAQLEQELSASNLAAWQDELREQEVVVYLPRFRMACMSRVDEALKAMGMTDAFDSARADFTGMDGRPHWLYLGAVLHKAYIEVNEQGTEAAAATAVTMEAGAAPGEPPPTFRADHPFIFMIREKESGTVLFMGRVIDPLASIQ